MMKLLLALIATTLCAAQAQARVLRVCADPNNLPFSNAAGEGFENRIMAALARDLGADLQYAWWAHRRGFVRNTLNAGRCDVVAGIAREVEMVATTPPYYRSTYVFVQRAGTVPVESLDDPQLAKLRIGVQLIGDDGANTPPAHALAQRGHFDNVRGYPVYGDYRESAPQAPIVNAVAQGEIDVALVWGPVGGYFARRLTPPLQVTPVTPSGNSPQWPMAFDISVGTRRQDAQLREELAQALQRNRAVIESILREYGVPLAGDADD